ncbi:hypothetical protein AB4Z38_16020, partial [Arthrobacter sp. 2RAF6]|uniref:hypothetical protein n=1 Tax=Arthrobacter sp. 2RAF6 TaxID=3233002 RepID=UPI003F93E031
MEAIGYFDTRQDLGPRGYFGASSSARGPRLAAVPGGTPGGPALVDPPDRGVSRAALDGAVAALRSLADESAGDVGGLGFQVAVAFASGVEELSRTLDYLQLLAAAGLDAARNDEPAARR